MAMATGCLHGAVDQRRATVAVLASISTTSLVSVRFAYTLPSPAEAPYSGLPPSGLRGRGEAEEKARLEVLDQPSVCRGRGVMELVYDDVVEGVRRELAQVTSPAERLDRGEEDVGVGGLLVAGVEAEDRGRANAAKSLERLAEDLFAVGHEQHPSERWPIRVEGGEPGLPQARGQHDETCGVAVGPRPFERGEGFSLHLVRFWRRQRLRGLGRRSVSVPMVAERDSGPPNRHRARSCSGDGTASRKLR